METKFYWSPAILNSDFDATYEMPIPYAHAKWIFKAAAEGQSIEQSRPDYLTGKMVLKWSKVNIFELTCPVCMLNNPAHFRVAEK